MSISDDLPVGISFIHFFDEVVVIFWSYTLVVSRIFNKDFGTDGTVFLV
jgi:hypothetical protein